MLYVNYLSVNQGGGLGSQVLEVGIKKLDQAFSQPILFIIYQLYAIYIFVMYLLVNFILFSQVC